MGEPVIHPPGPVPRDGGIHVLVEWAGFRKRDARPEVITDHRGRRWLVTRLVSYWESERYAATGQARPYGTIGAKWLLQVDGPLPGGGHGAGWVELRTYGDGAGYWLTPASAP